MEKSISKVTWILFLQAEKKFEHIASNFDDASINEIIFLTAFDLY